MKNPVLSRVYISVTVLLYLDIVPEAVGVRIRTNSTPTCTIGRGPRSDFLHRVEESPAARNHNGIAS